MDEQAAETCQVCEKTTTQRCSSCKTMYFCSVEHQKLAWPSHRWLCNLPLDTFSLAPLSSEEATFLEKNPVRTSIVPMDWKAILKRSELWQEGWNRESLLSDLKKTDCPIPEPLRSRTIANLHNFRQMCSLFPRPSVPPSGWILFGATIDAFFVAYTRHLALLPAGSNFFDVVGPVLRQFALFCTLRQAQKTRKAPMHLVRLAGTRTLEALDRLPLPPALKESLDTQLFIPISSVDMPDMGFDVV